MARSASLLWAFGSLLIASFVACDDDSGASLRNGNTPGRGTVPRPRDGGGSSSSSSGEPDAASSSSSSTSSSSSSGELDADVPDAGEVLPGYCRVADAFGISLPVPGLTSVQNALEFSITPDEQVVAWLESGAPVTVHVAGRVNEAVAFEAPTTVAYADAAFAGARGLTLSADGLHLVLVRSDGTALAELSRPARDVAFGTTLDSAPYVLVEPNVGTEGGQLGFPVFGRGDLMLAVQRIRPTEPAYSIQVSERAQAGDVWPLPSPRTEGVLAVTSAGSSQPKTITGISIDGLTVFVRNETTAALFAVNRPNEAGTFEPQYGRALAAAHAAIPNSTCDRLYVLESGELLVRRRIEE